MKYTKTEMIDLIKNIVFEVTRIQIDSQETNLLDTRLGIHPADFLYIFELLENELKVPVAGIFIDHNYTVMRVDYMSEALIKLLK